MTTWGMRFGFGALLLSGLVLALAGHAHDERGDRDEDRRERDDGRRDRHEDRRDRDDDHRDRNEDHRDRDEDRHGRDARPSPEVRISHASPFEDCDADAIATQPGEVFVGSEVEPWVAVNPRKPGHVVASWQQDRWSSGGARGIAGATSVDGGKRWRPFVLPGLTPCSGRNDFLRASDPWLAFLAGGDIVHMSLVVDRALLELLAGESPVGRSAMLAHRSRDGGRSWEGPYTIVDETFAGLHDKNAITAGSQAARRRLRGLGSTRLRGWRRPRPLLP